MLINYNFNFKIGWELIKNLTLEFISTQNEFIKNKTYESQWQKIGPIYIWQIYQNQKIDFFSDESYFETKEIDNSIYIGQIDKETEKPNGVMR